MGKTTKGTQAAASPEAVRTARRDGSSGGGETEPANAFRGKPERVPEVVFIDARSDNAFLDDAQPFYEFFGLEVHRVNSVAAILPLIAAHGSVYQRICIVSHAHPRGMIIPFVDNAIRGTNKEIFRGFAESNFAGLQSLNPAPPSFGKHLANWNTMMSFLMGVLRGKPGAEAILNPFGLQTSGTPSGNLREFFKFGFDIIFAREPGRVRRNASATTGLNAARRATLENFIEEIMNQMVSGLVSELGVTGPQVEALKTLLLGMVFSDLQPNIGSADAHLGLTGGNVNDFQTLEAIVIAVRGGFRDDLNAARQKINASTQIDVRGCRAGREVEYVESLREFFGRGEQKPMVTAPCVFQVFIPNGRFERPETHSNVANWINGTRWDHSSNELKNAFNEWAELLRVRPLHVNFWRDLLRGEAIRFGALGWRGDIPELFIPTPGLDELDGLGLGAVINKLKDYFDVASGDVPSSSDLSGIASVTTELAAWRPHLLDDIDDSMPSAERSALFNQLKQIDSDLGQSLVPDTSPNAPEPPTAVQLRGYQNDLVTFLETTPLAPIKTFMTAAADSLESGDGLYFYLLFAGLPVYVHRTLSTDQMGLVVLNPHQREALQSWYKCMWKDPLPASGDFLSANITDSDSRQFISVSEDHAHFDALCPHPDYMDSIRKRPLPPGETESNCPSDDIFP
jgi:hypothetical protein